ncbi:recombinase family protein [Pedobacter sp. GR22-10]|uniref:recombinase family protein n=1 Tax=Pedobacter sp. GR22-10 TaxID=2994472 RepID=UPI002245C3B5|nr:recombinase family protein [Pedobacter sp. GR22-10]MCX2430907.1 recombinase family protein [Pedobacter sp. GR22-10]
MGFKHTGSNAIFDILKNPLHAGLIRVPAYKKLPEKLVKGIHEAIVSETDFHLVQKMLSQKRRMQIRTDEDFPMRGVLKC